jgi:D-alanyl-D-alanine carboxypeptidase
MLESYEGVDGIKTGFIRDSGFNIVTSASRGGRRLVGAVFGGASWVERDAHMASLLDQGFERIGVPGRDTNRGPAILRTAQAGTLMGGASTARAEAPARAPARAAAASNRRPAQTAQGSRPAATARQAATTTRATSRQTATRTTSAARATPTTRSVVRSHATR